MGITELGAKIAGYDFRSALKELELETDRHDTVMQIVFDLYGTEIVKAMENGGNTKLKQILKRPDVQSVLDLHKSSKKST